MPKEEVEEKDTFDAIVEAIDALESEPDRHLSLQIDNSIQDAVKAAAASGQPSSVTIVVKMKSGPDRRMIFSASVAAKLPRPPVSAVVLYADDEGRIHKSDPDQLRMPFAQPTPISRKNEV